MSGAHGHTINEGNLSGGYMPGTEDARDDHLSIGYLYLAQDIIQGKQVKDYHERQGHNERGNLKTTHDDIGKDRE